MTEVKVLDRGLRREFAALWSDFLVEQYDLGSPIEPGEPNELVFAGLVDAYLRGSLFGLGLVSLDPDPCGCLLIGESPDRGLGLRTTWGRTAILWGVYVKPTHRQRGIANLMQEFGIPLVRELGFASIATDVLMNKAAEANAYGFEGQVAHSTMMHIDLRKGPRGR